MIVIFSEFHRILVDCFSIVAHHQIVEKWCGLMIKYKCRLSLLAHDIDNIYAASSAP